MGLLQDKNSSLLDELGKLLLTNYELKLPFFLKPLQKIVIKRYKVKFSLKNNNTFVLTNQNNSKNYKSKLT